METIFTPQVAERMRRVSDRMDSDLATGRYSKIPGWHATPWKCTACGARMKDQLAATMHVTRKHRFQS